MVKVVRLAVQTTGQGDVRNVTDEVISAVSNSEVCNGLLTVAVVGSTAAITTIEFEPGAVADFNNLLEQLAPRIGSYAHHERWGDDNGSSHVRAALLGASVTLPVIESKPVLGQWQQLVMVECDTRPRTREIFIQLIGD